MTQVYDYGYCPAHSNAACIYLRPFLLFDRWSGKSKYGSVHGYSIGQRCYDGMKL